jgi:hypothetical protein
MFAIADFLNRKNIWKKQFQKSGRGDWIRTNDHLLPKQIRYQAALHPELLESIFLRLIACFVYAFFKEL